MLKISRFIESVSYADKDQLAKTLIFSTRTGKARIVDTSSYLKLTTQNFSAFSELMLFDLQQNLFLVEETADELGEVLRENTTYVKNSDYLYFVIQPTANCQLGCGYCGQKHQSRRLSTDLSEKIIERITAKVKNSTGKKQLTLSWFGGEPLMALRNIRLVTPRLMTIAKDHGLTYRAHVTTNGMLLTAQVAQELVRDYGVKQIEVTLDGLEEHHDSRRHTKAGSPSFATIYNNLREIAALEHFDCAITIRCNVDKRNSSGVEPLIARLDTDGILKKFRFYIAPIHGWGNGAEKLAEEKQEFADRMIGWYMELMERGYPIQLLPKRKYDVCMAVNPEAELFDPFGNVFNCTEVSFVPAYEQDGKNKYRLGNLLEDSFDPAQRGIFGDFNEKIQRGETPCSSCKILPLCGGACPKEWLEGNIPCPSIKFNLPQMLLLAMLKGVQISYEGDTFPALNAVDQYL